MKKPVLFLTVCTMLVTMLAGCGGQQPSGNPSQTPPASSTPSGSATPDAEKNITIRVAWWGNQLRNDITVGVLNLYTESNPNVTFETEFSDWNGYWEKMATQAAAGSLPDIIQQDYSYYKQYQAKNQLVDLKPYADSGVINLSDVSESIINSGMVDGGLFALCLGINAPSMLYDKEAAAKAGVEIKNGMTREEVIAAAKKIYDATGMQYDYGYNDGPNQIEYIIRGQGKALFLDGKLGIDSASEVVPFFKMFEDGIASGVHLSAEDSNAAIGVGIEQDPLVLGKEWMSLAYSNQLAAFNNAAGKEYGIVTWPVGSDDTAKAMYLKPSQFFSVTSTSKNQEEEAKVLDFFTNSVEANEILLAERGVPISSKVAEAIKPLMNASNMQIFDYIAEIEPLTSTINPPSPQGMGEVIALINSLVEQVCYKQITAEKAADLFFTQAGEILAKAASN